MADKIYAPLKTIQIGNKIEHQWVRMTGALADNLYIIIPGMAYANKCVLRMRDETNASPTHVYNHINQSGCMQMYIGSGNSFGRNVSCLFGINYFRDDYHNPPFTHYHLMAHNLTAIIIQVIIGQDTGNFQAEATLYLTE